MASKKDIAESVLESMEDCGVERDLYVAANKEAAKLWNKSSKNPSVFQRIKKHIESKKSNENTREM